MDHVCRYLCSITTHCCSAVVNCSVGCSAVPSLSSALFSYCLVHTPLPTSSKKLPCKPSTIQNSLEKLRASTQQLLDQLYTGPALNIRDAQDAYGSIADALDSTAYKFAVSFNAELGHSSEARQLRQQMQEWRSWMHKLSRRYRELKSRMRELSRIHIMVLDRTLSTWESISLILSHDVGNYNERNFKSGDTSSNSRDRSNNVPAQYIRKRADATKQALDHMRGEVDAAAEEHQYVSTTVESMVERLESMTADANDLGVEAARSADHLRTSAEATASLGEAIGSLGNAPILAACAAVAAATGGAAAPVCLGMLGARGAGSALSALGEARSDVADRLQIRSEAYGYLVAEMNLMHKDTTKVSDILHEEKAWFQSTEDLISQTIYETEDIVLSLDFAERKLLLEMVQLYLKQLKKLRKQLDVGPRWFMASMAGTTAKIP